VRRLTVAVLLVVSACAPRWAGDPQLYGMALEVQLAQGNAGWALRDDLRARVRRVIDLGAGYWGLAPADVAGWRLVLTEGLRECGASATANGCTTDDDRTVTVAANYTVCIESSALVHELGHVALGDPEHRDPRWHDTDALRALWDDVHAGLAPAPDCGGEPYLGQWQGL
jgi:hypothetical protein